MAVDHVVETAAVGDENGIIMTSSPGGGGGGRRRRGSSITSHGSLRDQYLASEQDATKTSGTNQLPSPQASPRSTSPSLATTEHSAEWDEAQENLDDHHRSPSFEHGRGVPSIRVPSSEPAVESPKPISKILPPHELHNIPEERPRKARKLSSTKTTSDEKVLKLSPSEIEELANTPESLPMPLSATSNGLVSASPPPRTRNDSSPDDAFPSFGGTALKSPRPSYVSRTTSTPSLGLREPSRNESRSRQNSPRRSYANSSSRLDSVDANGSARPSNGRPNQRAPSSSDPQPFHDPHQDVPLPPLLSTYLQLELASSRPSPLYIPRPTNQSPFESSRVKFERLLNVLLLPPQLEQVLLFGALACLDSWLYTFTILPLRFLKAFAILGKWWLEVLVTEFKFISDFIYHGSGRMWERQRGRRSSSVDSASRSRSASRSARMPNGSTTSHQPAGRGDLSMMNGTVQMNGVATERRGRPVIERKHRRTKSQPSTLSSYHKADLLEGLVIICSSLILMRFDASRMYHSIRGQNAMKLYVIYNVLEVGDKLFAALGQDIFECLMSDEVLDRGADGRSRLLRPFGMFILALIYNVIHAMALFYQVITLNVAVNSYSNALLTLLMSNQFVEIKSSVFKKIEKDNLFQLTCADIVERFQIWLMLIIIGLRNIVEVGGLSVEAPVSGTAEAIRNATLPLRSSSILPHSFTLLPKWTGEVLSPFLIVLGSELLVDWVKHAYISKFNNVKPAVYQRFLDVLAKDYYTNAFVNQNLIKRLGLPVMALSCLFIRSSVQTYHMFLATHLPPPIPSSATSISVESAAASPATTAALEHFDNIIRRALGRSTYGNIDGTPRSWYDIGSDDIIAFITMMTFFLFAFLVLLVVKLILGMLLLKFARKRYISMKERANIGLDTKGKRVGSWGVVEMDEEKRNWIYKDDPDGMRNLQERQRKEAEKAEQTSKDGSGMDFEKIRRYEMTKRIW